MEITQPQKFDLINNGMFTSFYGFHKPKEDGGYLSNWFLSDFTVGKTEYSSVEQYLMHEKAILFKDYGTADKIMKTSDPDTIQQLGREVKPYDDKYWSAVRGEILYIGLWAKFTQNQELKDALLATEDNLLAECAYSDPNFAIKLGLDSWKITDYRNWIGQNILGFTLMKVRDDIKVSIGAS